MPWGRRKKRGRRKKKKKGDMTNRLHIPGGSRG
jgi:hypothetical protein